MMMMRTLPTSFNVTNVPLRLLITQAYRLSSYQLVGAPSWIDSERFDIVAKAPEGSRPDQTMLMLRGLLAERFKLKVHGETRETQVYALVLARSDGKLGPKLSKSTDDCEKILAERRAAAVAARAGGAGPVPFTMPGPNEKPVCTISMRPTPVTNGMPVLNFRGGGQPMQTLVSQISSIAEQTRRRSYGSHRPLRFRAAVLDGDGQMPLTTQARGSRRHHDGGADRRRADDVRCGS